MTPNIFDFFSRLEQNNNRPWFQEHKAEYDAIRAQWIAGMARIIQTVSQHWPEVKYLDPARCTYRIYRDVRFSNNKTPYKTHISSSVYNPSLKGMHTGLYIEAGTGNGDPGTGVYAGIWCPESDVLKKLRKAIADNAEEFLDIVNEPEFVRVYGRQWLGDKLKTAPKGYEKDHPMIEYLRLKDIGKFAPLPRQVFDRDDWPEVVAQAAIPAIPLIKFLDYSITEQV